MIPDGFKDLVTNAYTILLDYFPLAQKNEYNKLWIGTGLEYWENVVINSDNNLRGSYNNLVLTIGSGYIWNIIGNFYLNPWAAIHYAVNGTNDKIIDGKTYEPSPFLYEVSLKIGFYF